jgi:hypothetical protein
MRRIGDLPRIVCLLIIAAVFLSGCTLYSSRFSPPVKQESQVVLRENDFRYIERNLEGSHSYWALWLIIDIPLSDPRLFSSALADLYADSQQQVEGKTTQLINWALDYDELLLPLLRRKRATFRADLIEYTK